MTRAPRWLPEATEYIEAAMPRLLRTAYGLTGNRPDAEDLVQDTIERVIAKWPSVRRADSPDAYVRRILVNRFLSGRRARRSGEVVSHELATADRAASTTSAQAAVISHVSLVQALETLPERQRVVLVLRYVADLPDRAIAEVLECDPAAVRATAHRALTTLRVRTSRADDLQDQRHPAR